jgi:hypothetical protein
MDAWAGSGRGRCSSGVDAAVGGCFVQVSYAICTSPSIATIEILSKPPIKASGNCASIADHRNIVATLPIESAVMSLRATAVSSIYA